VDRPELRVLLATSSPILQMFFAELANDPADPFIVDAVTATVSALEEQLDALRAVNIAVVDMAPMPDLTAVIGFCETLHRQRPTLPVVALVHEPRDVNLWQVRCLFSGELSGLLDLQATSAEMRLALRGVLGGAIVVRLQGDLEHGAGLPAALASSSSDSVVTHTPDERVPPLTVMTPAPASSLTVRERQVLNLLASGWTNKRIARELDLSENTVEGHERGIYTKLGVHSRTEAVFQAQQWGVLLPPTQERN